LEGRRRDLLVRYRLCPIAQCLDASTHAWKRSKRRLVRTVRPRDPRSARSAIGPNATRRRAQPDARPPTLVRMTYAPVGRRYGGEAPA
jgi:hypothetical protein